jgi:uncharacterized LabA/DUF88 family protein
MPPQRPAVLRCVVFIDGQNLYYACKKCFGHALAYPQILAQELVADDAHPEARRVEQVRFYSGLHDPNVNPAEHATLTRRLEAMRAAGVVTVTRKLKYADEWIENRQHKPGVLGSRRFIRVRKGREKGIDVRIALDLVRMARHREYDVAILVSQDSDLNEAVEEVMSLRDELGLWLAVENAVAYVPTSDMVRLRACKRVHRITHAMFAKALDPTDYSKPTKAPPAGATPPATPGASPAPPPSPPPAPPKG